MIKWTTFTFTIINNCLELYLKYTLKNIDYEENTIIVLKFHKNNILTRYDLTFERKTFLLIICSKFGYWIL